MGETRTDVDRKTTVTVSPVTLAEIWAFACQSGEFVHIVGMMQDAGNG